MNTADETSEIPTVECHRLEKVIAGVSSNVKGSAGWLCTLQTFTDIVNTIGLKIMIFLKKKSFSCQSQSVCDSGIKAPLLLLH